MIEEERPKSSSLGWEWGTEFGCCLWWVFSQVTGLNTRPFQLTVEKLELALQGVNSEVWGFSQIQGCEWVASAGTGPFISRELGL